MDKEMLARYQAKLDRITRYKAPFYKMTDEEQELAISISEDFLASLRGEEIPEFLSYLARYRKEKEK